MHTRARREGDGGGPQFGATVTLQRNLVGGLWLGASLEAASIRPLVLECADCYEPFDEGIGLLGLSFSASYRLP